MSVKVKSGKVVLTLRDHQATLTPTRAIKLGLALLDAGKKAAKRAKAFRE